MVGVGFGLGDFTTSIALPLEFFEVVDTGVGDIGGGLAGGVETGGVGGETTPDAGGVGALGGRTTGGVVVVMVGAVTGRGIVYAFNDSIVPKYTS